MTIDALNKIANLVALATAVRTLIEKAQEDGYYEAGEDDETLKGMVFEEEATVSGANE